MPRFPLINVENGSKVLLSSRVRPVLEDKGVSSSSCVIDLQLPTEEEAVQMLLLTAGIAATGTTVPAEAKEIVKFCKMLPLSITIAAKMLEDLSIEDDADWDGVLQVLKEEFESDGGARSVEDTIIATSLKGIQGPHKANITLLFKALALAAEDTRIPPGIQAMMFEATASSDSPVTQPSRIQIRRWMKSLIDRSLVIGTVDRPQLHDIVGDYVKGMFENVELHQSHQRFVEVLRTSRPLGHSGEREWKGDAEDPNSVFVRVQVRYHIEQSCSPSLVNADVSVRQWLLDCPQDDICLQTAMVLGVDTMSTIATDASDEGWAFARLANLTGNVAGASSPATAAQWWRKTLDALALIEDEEALFHAERIGLSTMLALVAFMYPEDLRYLPYLAKLMEVKRLERCGSEQAFGHWVLGFPHAFTGDLDNLYFNFLKFPQALALHAANNPDPVEQIKSCILLHTTDVVSVLYRMDGFDWEQCYGDKGAHLMKGISCYDYDQYHKFVIKASAGIDNAITGMTGAKVLTYRFGQLAATWDWMERCMDYWHRAATDSEKAREMWTVTLTVGGWFLVAFDLGRGEYLLEHREKNGFGWSAIDAKLDECALLVPNIRPRGDDTMGMHYADVAGFSWLYKCQHLMLSPEPASIMSAEEFKSSLPTVDELSTWFNAGFPHSVLACFQSHGDYNCTMLTAYVLERFKFFPEAIEYASAAMTSDLSRSGGACRKDSDDCPVQWMRMGMLIARCNSALGKPAEAKAGFEVAAKDAAKSGLYWLEIQALCNLKVHVLDKEDGAAPDAGLAPIKGAVDKLLGPDFKSEDMEVLARAPILSGLTLSTIMAS